MRWAMASRACDWPTIRSSMRSFRARTVWISSVTMRPTGMPVQPETTSAIACESTQTCISGVLALKLLRVAPSSSASSRAELRPLFVGQRLGRRPARGGGCRGCRCAGFGVPASWRPSPAAGGSRSPPSPAARGSRGSRSTSSVSSFQRLPAPPVRLLRLRLRLRQFVEPLVVVGAGRLSRAAGCSIADVELLDARGGSLRRPAAWPPG